MVYGTGTHVRNWRSGSGYSGRTTSQTLVGSLANPPVKRSVLKPLLWLLLVFVVFGTAIRSVSETILQPATVSSPAPIIDGPRAKVSRKRTMPTRPVVTPEQRQRSLVVFAGVGLALAALIVWRIVSAIRFNHGPYPILLRVWQSSFMCRACGAVFQPANAEQIMLQRGAGS